MSGPSPKAGAPRANRAYAKPLATKTARVAWLLDHPEVWMHYDPQHTDRLLLTAVYRSMARDKLYERLGEVPYRSLDNLLNEARIERRARVALAAKRGV